MSRRKSQVLYLGTDPSRYSSEGEITHFSVIEIVPRSLEDEQLQGTFLELSLYTHLLFTSKHAVLLFFEALREFKIEASELNNKKILAVGKTTAGYLERAEVVPHFVATEECQEGIIALLQQQDLADAYLFWPRSAQARELLSVYLKQHRIKHQSCALYDTVTKRDIRSLPDLEAFDEIVFTSPSTVDAFLELYCTLPKDKRLVAIGSITEARLQEKNLG